jgi:hypothetical protein
MAGATPQIDANKKQAEEKDLSWKGGLRTLYLEKWGNVDTTSKLMTFLNYGVKVVVAVMLLVYASGAQSRIDKSTSELAQIEADYNQALRNIASMESKYSDLLLENERLQATINATAERVRTAQSKVEVLSFAVQEQNTSVTILKSASEFLSSTAAAAAQEATLAVGKSAEAARDAANISKALAEAAGQVSALKNSSKILNASATEAGVRAGEAATQANAASDAANTIETVLQGLSATTAILNSTVSNVSRQADQALTQVGLLAQELVGLQNATGLVNKSVAKASSQAEHASQVAGAAEQQASQAFTEAAESAQAVESSAALASSLDALTTALNGTLADVAKNATAAERVVNATAKNLDILRELSAALNQTAQKASAKATSALSTASTASTLAATASSPALSASSQANQSAKAAQDMASASVETNKTLSRFIRKFVDNILGATTVKVSGVESDILAEFPQTCAAIQTMQNNVDTLTYAQHFYGYATTILASPVTINGDSYKRRLTLQQPFAPPVKRPRSVCGGTDTTLWKYHEIYIKLAFDGICIREVGYSTYQCSAVDPSAFRAVVKTGGIRQQVITVSKSVTTTQILTSSTNPTAMGQSYSPSTANPMGTTSAPSTNAPSQYTPPAYYKFTTGTCSSNGCSLITTVSECDAAAVALQIYMSSSSIGSSTWPTGCVKMVFSLIVNPTVTSVEADPINTGTEVICLCTGGIPTSAPSQSPTSGSPLSCSPSSLSPSKSPTSCPVLTTASPTSTLSPSGSPITVPASSSPVTSSPSTESPTSGPTSAPSETSYYFRYVNGNNGLCQSVSGCSILSSQSECESAAVQLGTSDTTATTEIDTNYPRGCYYWAGGTGTGLYFNMDNVGSYCQGNSYCLCRCIASPTSSPTIPPPTLPPTNSPSTSSPTFTLVTSGTCADSGCTAITTGSQCNNAAIQLSLVAHSSLRM